MNCQSIFVYGTLQPGEINDHHFDPFQGQWQKGHVLGDLKDSGWGAEYGFPGIRLNPAGDRVKGSVFVSPDIEKILVLLDALEGAEYQRSMTTVFLDDGQKTEAYIYELAEQ